MELLFNRVTVCELVCLYVCQSLVSKRVIPVCTMVNVEQDIKVIIAHSWYHDITSFLFRKCENCQQIYEISK